MRLISLVARLAKHWHQRSGLGDAGQFDGVVENSNRVDLIAQILQGAEPFANGFSPIDVTTLDRPQQFHRLLRSDTDTSGGESGDAKVTQMNERGLFSDPADHSFRWKHIQDLPQVVILARIVSHHCVLDPRYRAVGFQ